MSFDTQRADEFAGRLIDVMNGAGLALMTSVGHRTGLLDALAERPGTTSEELAAAAGLNERYVREWLAALTTARVVEYDAGARRYTLPAEHAAVLTRAASPNNLAVMAQYLAVLGAVEDDVVACFRDGGGVPYERFGRFHEVMAEDSDQTTLSALEGAILPLVPGLPERLEAGIDVADLGCGRGRALLRLAERFPRSRFTGWDLSADAIGWARREAAARGLRNLRLEARDLSTLDRDAAPATFDLVTTFDAVHDQKTPRALLAGIRRLLRPDGVYLMQDIAASSALHENLDHPLAPFMYAVSCLHCMTVSLAQGGDGLGTMWGEQRARALLGETGFGRVEVHRLPHDIQNLYFVARP